MLAGQSTLFATNRYQKGRGSDENVGAIDVELSTHRAEQRDNTEVINSTGQNHLIWRPISTDLDVVLETLDMDFDLNRFVKAQQHIYDTALSELTAGRKRSHWMWFIFPQIHGLGRSETARFYAIEGRAEAEAYLVHPVLGPRLVDCTQAMLSHSNLTAHDVLGSPDDLKFRSSMTLFAAVSEDGSLFETAIKAFNASEYDQATLRMLKTASFG